ncbi:AMIN domain-containing protein, partial [Myxococcota bacterium]|nr:AMIN domain-containing protein [Myxococcota bacterium]
MMRLARSIKNLEYQVAIGYMAVLLAAALLSAPAVATVPQAGPEKTGAVEVLSDLRVESGASGTRMTLQGVQTARYSVKESSDGQVLTIELANVREAHSEAGEEEPGSASGLSVYDGLINQVMSSTFEGKGGPTTRVEVILAAPASLEPLSDQPSLVFLVRPQVALPLASAPLSGKGSAADRSAEREAVEEVLQEQAEDPWAVAETIADLNEKGSDELVGGGALAPSAASSTRQTALTASSARGKGNGQGAAKFPVEGRQVTTLRAVSFEVMEGGILLNLRADGVLGNTQAFAIEDPDRLVIDLYGVQSGLDRDTLVIGSPEVERVRFGAHADKLRIVLDGGPDVDGFQGRHLQPTEDGLVLAVGKVSGQALAEFAESARAQVVSEARVEGPVAESV